MRLRIPGGLHPWIRLPSLNWSGWRQPYGINKWMVQVTSPFTYCIIVSFIWLIARDRKMVRDNHQTAARFSPGRSEGLLANGLVPHGAVRTERTRREQ
jgi:hypothetical protein